MLIFQSVPSCLSTLHYLPVCQSPNQSSLLLTFRDHFYAFMLSIIPEVVVSVPILLSIYIHPLTLLFTPVCWPLRPFSLLLFPHHFPLIPILPGLVANPKKIRRWSLASAGEIKGDWRAVSLGINGVLVTFVSGNVTAGKHA